LVAREGEVNIGGGQADWVFIVGGFALAALALVMIFKKFDVTSGHAIVLAVALGVACLPYVANFEWTKEGFKFTTKTETSQLATEVANLTKQDTATREQLSKIGEALQAATERLVALEASRPSDAPPPPDSGRFDRRFDWKESNGDKGQRFAPSRLAAIPAPARTPNAIAREHAAGQRAVGPQSA
jgi:hypothetical protein